MVGAPNVSSHHEVVQGFRAWATLQEGREGTRGEWGDGRAGQCHLGHPGSHPSPEELWVQAAWAP